MDVDIVEGESSIAQASTSGPPRSAGGPVHGLDPRESAEMVGGTSRSASSSAFPLLYSFDIEGLSPSHLTGTSDVLSALGLRGTYDRSVRQYLNLPGSRGSSQPPIRPAADIKGKGRASLDDSLTTDLTAKPEDPTEGTREKAKMKKHYSHMIADVPGQNRLAKDRHLHDLLLNPEPPDGTNVALLDDTALREGFTLEVGMLPDFDASIWRADADDQARKKRKRRKQEEPVNGATKSAPSPASAVPSSGLTVNLKKRRID